MSSRTGRWPLTTIVTACAAGTQAVGEATELIRRGAEDVVIIERDVELGGILLQCIHSGFGIHEFGEDKETSPAGQPEQNLLPRSD